jgi:hypothetical protein
MADGISPAFPGYERTVSGALAEDRHAVNTIAEAPANPERGLLPIFLASFVVPRLALKLVRD